MALKFKKEGIVKIWFIVVFVCLFTLNCKGPKRVKHQQQSIKTEEPMQNVYTNKVQRMLVSDTVRVYALTRKRIRSTAVGMPLPSEINDVVECKDSVVEYLISSLNINNEPYKNIIITEALFYIVQRNMGNNNAFWLEKENDRSEAERIIKEWQQWGKTKD
jgi:hypothetical protein